MLYVSTRGSAPKINFEQTATSGLASDGGLYVPAQWPKLSTEEIRQMKGLSYTELATHIIGLFCGDSIPQNKLQQLITAAYSDFDHPDVAPFSAVSSRLGLLELFHGPTYSFKDYALQFLGNLMNWSLESDGRHLTIVGATSGDTGSAAIHAVQGLPTIDLFMLHPHERVSSMQRLQMTTSHYSNIHNLAVDGTFDDCQAMVKLIFADQEVSNQLSLGAVNSINWARIAAQVVYYFYAALQLGAPDVKVSFSVPTGNFGNVFAGYVASVIGLPIEQMIVCSNENDILTRFFATGTMRKHDVKSTLSPSMDIQVSSNFERFLFEMLDRNSDVVTEKMQEFANTGEFSVDQSVLNRAQSHFIAHRINDEQTFETIAALHATSGLIVDPHTAIAWASAEQFQSQLNGPIAVIATAHPAKFAATIERSTGTKVQLPCGLQSLVSKPEHYKNIANDVDQLKQIMLQH